MINYIDYNEDDLQAIKIDKTIISNGKLLGSCELGNAEIRLLNPNNKYSNSKNQWIRTVKGSFFIEDVEPNQEQLNITLKCKDIKKIMDVIYDSKDYQNLFPMPILEWRNRMADYLGITFNDNDNFPNANFVLDSHPYVENNSSYRTVFKMISEACASFIDVDDEDKFYFSWISNEEAISIEDWNNLTTEKKSTDEVNVVVLGRGDIEDTVFFPNPKPEEPHELRIDNNYVLDPQLSVDVSQDRRYQVIEPIYNRVNGFKYIIFDMTTQDLENPFLVKLGSKVKYPDMYGNQLESIVMSQTFNWLGGNPNESKNWEITISASELKETSTNFNYSGSIKQNINKIGVNVDKLNAQIQSIVESAYNFSQETKGNQFVLLPKIQGNGIFELDIHGNMDFSYVDEAIVDESYLKDSYLILETTKDEEVIKKRIYLPIEKFEYISERHHDTFSYKLIYDEEQKKYISKAFITRIDNSIEELEMPVIEFEKGDYKVYMEDFTNIHFYIKYAIQNEVTNLLTTQAEFQTSITQTERQIELLAKEKVDNDEIIARLNVAIKDDKGVVELKGNSVIIESDHFKLDENGSVTANDVTLTGGSINYTTSLGNVTIGKGRSGLIYMSATNSSDRKEYSGFYNVAGLGFNKEGTQTIRITGIPGNEHGFFTYNSGGSVMAKLITLNDEAGRMYLYDPTGASTIQCNAFDGRISCTTLVQTSLESQKKNFEKFENALSEIENIDIYKYNYKHEDKDKKKHLGFVIGNKYNYSHLITSVDDNDNEVGVDLYSMCSLCLQAIKEQQKEIENLKQIINQKEVIK